MPANRLPSACRLVDGLTWDDLLSTVRTLNFGFKVLHGTWCLGLGLAAARLKGSRSLKADDTDWTGYSRICSKAVERPDTSYTCPRSCRACASCLMAEQVNPPGRTDGLAYISCCTHRQSTIYSGL